MKCKGLTKKGNPCKNNAIKNGFCHIHYKSNQLGYLTEMPNQQKNLERKKSEYHFHLFSLIVNILILMVLGISGYIGFRALRAYEVENNISREISNLQRDGYLQQLDGGVYDFLLQKGEAYLFDFFYHEPHDTLSPKERAEEIMQNIMRGPYEDWTTIPELYENLQNLNESAKRTTDVEKRRILEGQYERFMTTLLISERILFATYTAFEMNQKGVLSDELYNDWVVYIEDFGRNPIFLSAVYLNHKLRYFDKDFAEEISNRLKNEEFVIVLYPDIFEPKWLNHFDKDKE